MAARFQALFLREHVPIGPTPLKEGLPFSRGDRKDVLYASSPAGPAEPKTTHQKAVRSTGNPDVPASTAHPSILEAKSNMRGDQTNHCSIVRDPNVNSIAHSLSGKALGLEMIWVAWCHIYSWE
jgi:hypothetical protein